MSWYSTGYDGVSKEEQRLNSLSGPGRLYLAAGTAREIVTVDDEPFCIYEHNAKINNSWRNQHTCNKGVEETCFSCQHLGDKSRYFIGYLTCVDCTENIDKKGNKYQFEVKLVGAKVGLLKKWKRKKQDKTSLLYAKWGLFREDDKKSSVGDDWELKGEVTDHAKMFALANYRGKKLSELFDKAEQNEDAMRILKLTFQLEFGQDGKLVRRVPAFNYMEVLKPRGNEAARDLLGGVSRDAALGKSAEGGGDVADNDGREDAVPF